jgi:hypothetical protein
MEMSRELSKSGRSSPGCQLGLLDFFLKKIKKGQNKIRCSFTHAKGLALDLSMFSAPWPLHTALLASRQEFISNP